MLESIRKLMAKRKEGVSLHSPRPPHVRAASLLTQVAFSRAAAETAARQLHAIKLRPRQPISACIRRFPPRDRRGRGDSRGRMCGVPEAGLI